jgi:hypothetical protein
VRPGSSDTTNALASSSCQQDAFRSGRAGEQIGQFAVDPVQQGRAQQQTLYVGRLPLQHLGHQVLGDRTVTAGELGDEPFGIRVPGQGEHGEPQTGRPPLGALVQQAGHMVGQHDSGGAQELAGLGLREAQLRGADLGQFTGEPQLVQAQRRVVAGGHDRVDTPGEVRQQGCQLLDGLWGAEFVQVVDDEEEGSAGRRDLGEDLVHHGAAVEAGGHDRRLRGVPGTGRGTDRVQQGQPEQLRVLLARPYGHERDTAVLSRPVDPCAQERRLSAAGGRGDHRHLLLGRAVQGGEQVAAVDETGPGRCAVRTRWGRQVGHRARSYARSYAMSCGHAISLADSNHRIPAVTCHLRGGDPERALKVRGRGRGRVRDRVRAVTA